MYKRWMAVLFLLLATASVEAGESRGWPTTTAPSTEKICYIWQDRDEGLKMEGPDCPDRAIDKDESLHKRLVCAQRMRKAMDHMDFWMASDRRRKEKGIPPISDKPLHETDFWKSVMQDCVK